jgi:hypothetical protein
MPLRRRHLSRARATGHRVRQISCPGPVHDEMSGASGPVCRCTGESSPGRIPRSATDPYELDAIYPLFGMPKTMIVPLVADTQNRLFWRDWQLAGLMSAVFLCGKESGIPGQAATGRVSIASRASSPCVGLDPGGLDHSDFPGPAGRPIAGSSHLTVNRASRASQPDSARVRAGSAAGRPARSPLRDQVNGYDRIFGTHGPTRHWTRSSPTTAS